jgi:diguanylate cyclase (GGDEF)-like protein
MAEEIARKHGEILTLNNELEERVMERTAQLRELASREPLTGLYNRRHFSETLARRLSEAKRYGTELSLLMTDMDDFKTVNDSHGHQLGDELLMLAARTISRQLRAADVAARYGGDEFMILVPHSDASQAQALASRIIDHFHAECRAKYPQIRISLSVGIASITECNAASDDEFIRAADRALYEAKSLGKNRIVHGATIGQ